MQGKGTFVAEPKLDLAGRRPRPRPDVGRTEASTTSRSSTPTTPPSRRVSPSGSGASDVLRIDWLLRLRDHAHRDRLLVPAARGGTALERVAIRGARLGSGKALALDLELDHPEISVATSHCSPYNAERLGDPRAGAGFPRRRHRGGARSASAERPGRRGRPRDLSQRHAVAPARVDDRRRRAADRRSSLGRLTGLRGQPMTMTRRWSPAASATAADTSSRALAARGERVVSATTATTPKSADERGHARPGRALRHPAAAGHDRDARRGRGSSTPPRCPIPTCRSSSRRHVPGQRRGHRPPVRGSAPGAGRANRLLLLGDGLRSRRLGRSARTPRCTRRRRTA